METKEGSKKSQALISPKNWEKIKINCDIHGEQEVLNIGMKKAQCPKCVEIDMKKTEDNLLRVVKEDSIEKELRIAGVRDRHIKATFENYETKHDWQKEIVNQCRWFFKNSKYITGLIFLGMFGTGKNHIAVALMREFLKIGKTVKIITFLDFMREIKAGYGTGDSEKEIINRYKRPYLLVLDEIGRQFRSETELIMLHDIIDKRYLDEKPTILMTNLNLEDLTEVVGEAGIDRIEEGAKGQRTVHFVGDSYRKKKA